MEFGYRGHKLPGISQYKLYRQLYISWDININVIHAYRIVGKHDVLLQGIGLQQRRRKFAVFLRFRDYNEQYCQTSHPVRRDRKRGIVKQYYRELVFGYRGYRILCVSQHKRFRYLQLRNKHIVHVIHKYRIVGKHDVLLQGICI
jgi:hypothetical protein